MKECKHEWWLNRCSLCGRGKDYWQCSLCLERRPVDIYDSEVVGVANE